MFIAKDEDTYISAHRTRGAALKAILKYRGFTDSEIKDMMDKGEDITAYDFSAQIIETVR